MTVIRKMEAAILAAFGDDRGEELRVTMNGRTLTGAEVVRAALLAIREPSEDMAEAGRESAEEGKPHPCWTAMIDHILNGGE